MLVWPLGWLHSALGDAAPATHGDTLRSVPPTQKPEQRDPASPRSAPDCLPQLNPDSLGLHTAVWR